MVDPPDGNVLFPELDGEAADGAASFTSGKGATYKSLDAGAEVVCAEAEGNWPFDGKLCKKSKGSGVPALAVSNCRLSSDSIA